MHGDTLSGGVKEGVGSAGKWPEDFYNEYCISTNRTGTLKADTRLYFPVVQQGAQGVSRWIDIPADPAHAKDSKSPAPGVRLIPKP